MIHWQWEQGRIEYFQFENILAMSRALVEKDGMLVSDVSADKELRDIARHSAGLEFFPQHYTIWRNYARVFKAMLLATDVPVGESQKRVLKCTNLCKFMANGRIHTATDYIVYVMRAFYLNGPVFNAQNYYPRKKRVFPFCALVRLLVATAYHKGEMSCISPDDAKNLLFSREISGTESMEFFQNLSHSKTSWAHRHQHRQVREMFIFASQCSFLKWDGQKLCLDLPVDSLADRARELFNWMSPMVRQQRKNTAEEILNLGHMNSRYSDRIILPSEENLIIGNDPIANDNMSREGRRRAVNHIIIERSPKLRDMFFAKNKTAVCDITGAPRHAGFPWVKNILEIHHVTPLSSPIHSTDEGTSFNDLVPLTPTSHRAIHAYYRKWMHEQNRDFKDKNEAWEVYRSAKSEYVRSRKTKK